jgi:hypothetical protein
MLCLLSIEYKNFYKILFTLTGLLPGGECNLLHLRSEDKEQMWRCNNRKKDSVKISWMRNLYIKLREGRERLVMDNAKYLRFESEMMGPTGGGVTGTTSNNKPSEKAKEKNNAHF